MRARLVSLGQQMTAATDIDFHAQPGDDDFQEEGACVATGHAQASWLSCPQKQHTWVIGSLREQASGRPATRISMFAQALALPRPAKGPHSPHQDTPRPRVPARALRAAGACWITCAPRVPAPDTRGRCSPRKAPEAVWRHGRRKKENRRKTMGRTGIVRLWRLLQ